MLQVNSKEHSNEGAVNKALLKAQEMKRHQRLLEKLGPARSAIKTILDFGSAVAELNPAAKATFAVCTKAWEKLEAEEKCDASIETLVEGLSAILPFVEIVKKAAKLPHLQTTIVSLLNLIEDASRFIAEYKLDGAVVPTLRALVSSSAQGQVDKLLGKLQDLKEAFDRGINVQMFQTVDMDAQRNLLKELKPVGKARYDPIRACLPGTRSEILEEIANWFRDSDASNSLLWVHGQAGLGKSAIATSTCQRLDKLGALSASFFCKRDDPELRDPQRVLATIIYGLASRHRSYANAVAAAIHADTSLCSSPTEVQYVKLLKDLLGLLKEVIGDTRYAVVVDALDE
ncbi:hypothetical protein FRC07_001623 [Ceratobasidium sp. 392]|nr:hypothetical protein FRC07_001623 [Ceratobasidium sp. 392]